MARSWRLILKADPGRHRDTPTKDRGPPLARANTPPRQPGNRRAVPNPPRPGRSTRTTPRKVDAIGGLPPTGQPARYRSWRSWRPQACAQRVARPGRRTAVDAGLASASTEAASPETGAAAEPGPSADPTGGCGCGAPKAGNCMPGSAEGTAGAAEPGRPVAAAGGGTSFSVTVGAPPRGPISTPRAATFCSTLEPSTTLPKR